MTQETARILVADHRGSELEARAAYLGSRGYEVARSRSLRETVRQAAAFGPALILLEPMTRGGNEELEAVDLARGEIPLLLVCERTDREAPQRAGRALTGGAWDLVFRDAPDDELELRVLRLFEQAALRRERNELRHMASHDDRTDLLRPKAFQARLLEHFSAAQRHELELALVLLDLDKFGAINKRHDHTVGDAVIEKVGAEIRRNLRTEDVAGRLGGDEFAVLLPYTGKINAASVVSRLRAAIAKLSGRVEGAREDIPVSASIGFETFDGKDLDSLETLRRHAEIALRQAKSRGGDQAIYYRNPPPDAPPLIAEALRG
jgi:diguanylate cyclase (GGDEF)-like protein